MRSSEVAQARQPPMFSGLTITRKPRTKVLKYLLKDRYYICKYIALDDEQSLIQVRSFLIWRQRGREITFYQSSQLPLYLKIDIPFFDSVPIIQEQNLPLLIRSLIGKLILATNLNLYSTDNIMNNPITGQLQLNSISIVGIIPLWKKTQFTFQQFKQIYELLSLEVFDAPSFDRKFSFRLKFRSLGMAILKNICRKDISLLKAIFKQSFPQKIKYSEGRQLCKKLPELFKSILSNNEIRKKIVNAQRRDSLSYGLFLESVFLNTSQEQDMQTLSWHQVISLLIPGSLVSKDSSMNEELKDLQYIFMEYYKALSDQAKEQLRSLGLQSRDWQILFKLSIGENALDLDLQQYFKSANDVQLNKQIIETTMRAIASSKRWVSKSLYQCFDIMRKDSYSSEENISTDIVKSQQLGQSFPQGKQTNIKEIEMNLNHSSSFEQNLSQQNQQQGLAVELNLEGLIEPQPNNYKMQNCEKSGSLESIEQRRSTTSLYYMQGDKQGVEREISQEQIRILSKMGRKLRGMQIQLQNTTIRALNPKMKMLNRFLRLSS